MITLTACSAVGTARRRLSTAQPRDVRAASALHCLRVRTPVGTFVVAACRLAATTTTTTTAQALIIDEADRILEIGFEEEMVQILRKLPLERQTILFSATQVRGGGGSRPSRLVSQVIAITLPLGNPQASQRRGPVSHP